MVDVNIFPGDLPGECERKREPSSDSEGKMVTDGETKSRAGVVRSNTSGRYKGGDGSEFCMGLVGERPGFTEIAR